MSRKVVITGIGPVTGIGIGKDTFFKNILEHHTCIKEIPDNYSQNYHFKSRFYVPPPLFKFEDYGINPGLAEIMEETTKIAVISAKLALEDAGFILEEKGRFFTITGLNDTAVIVGIGISALQTAFQSYLAHLFGKNSPILAAESIEAKFNRMAIPMLMPNAAAAWISILFGLNGPGYTLNASCASGTYGIGDAYRKIMSGECDSALAGGVECLHEKYGSIMRGFDMLTILTKSEDGYPWPFSTKRSGFLFNEGAGCILVLEELNHAKKRGARIYAQVDDYQANSDALNIIQMEDSGEKITALIDKVCKDKVIDYFNTHGTCTIANDQIEAKVIQKLFGSSKHQPYINSTKGILGHSIGASGALEVGVTALSIFHGKVHGNRIVDPLEDLNLVTETCDANIEYAISTSYGFGGHNAILLLKRYHE